MNKNNRKKFERRIDNNRLWLANHLPITQWCDFYESAINLLNDPNLFDISMGSILHFVSGRPLEEISKYVHF